MELVIRLKNITENVNIFVSVIAVHQDKRAKITSEFKNITYVPGIVEEVQNIIIGPRLSSPEYGNQNSVPLSFKIKIIWHPDIEECNQNSNSVGKLKAYYFMKGGIVELRFSNTSYKIVI